MARVMMPIRCFKLTTDDDELWSPSYKLDGWYKGTLKPRLLEVSILPLTDGKVRVCVWGGEERGMNRDFQDENEARRMWDYMMMLDTLAFRDLYRLGFRSPA